MSNTPFILNMDWFNDYIEKNFSSYFLQTRKLNNDYWYIWAKSGLIDFICLKLREKYSIKILDYSKDYVSGEVLINEFDTMSLDTHEFYDSWDRKKDFRKELEKIIYELKIHRATFVPLFEKIFYDFPIDVNEKWQGVDMDVIYNITLSNQEPFIIEGFTKEEIKKIKSEITRNLKRKLNRKKLNNEEKQVINNWCNQFSRRSRAPKSKEEVYQVIEQLKHYKHNGNGLDAEKKGIAETRITSGAAATNILGNLSEEIKIGEKQYSNVWFRVFVKDLYSRFTLLHDFIIDYQKKLPT